MAIEEGTNVESNPATSSSIHVVSSDLQNVRSGRLLYVKNLIVGSNIAADDGNLDSVRQTTINVICVHGTAGSHGQYIPMLTELHAHIVNASSSSSEQGPLKLNCWLYDGVGCGESPIPLRANNYESSKQEYSDDNQVEDLYSVLTKSQQQERRNPPTSTDEGMRSNFIPTILIGHSYGTNIIAKLLQRYPHLISPSSPSASTGRVVGCVFISSGVLDGPAPMINGGPFLFKLPLFVLSCM